MSCLEGLVVKAHVSSRKLGLEKLTPDKRITGADYIKPEELLVNIRTANVQSLMKFSFGLVALGVERRLLLCCGSSFGFRLGRSACGLFVPSRRGFIGLSGSQRLIDDEHAATA